MKHKWYNEIVAWAGGAEIEFKSYNGYWIPTTRPKWDLDFEYRIKPQPKETQYLYAWKNTYSGNEFFTSEYFSPENDGCNFKYIGKIKLEQDDE